MKLKRFVTAVLAMAMVASMTACGNDAAVSKTSEASSAAASTGSAVETAQAESGGTDFSTSEEQAKAYDDYIAGLSGKYEGKTLNVVTVSDPWLTGMEETVAKFEELTGCKVSFSELGYDACYSKETLIASQKSNEADVFIYDYPWIGALSDSLMELDDVLEQNAALVDYEDFFQVGREGTSWNGKKLGFPFAPYFTMLTYNTDLFEQAGITEAPSTVEDLKAAAEKLTTDSVAGIALNNQSGTCVGQAYFEWIYAFGGKVFESCYPGSTDYYADMTPCLTSEESLAVVKFFKDMLPYEGSGALNMSWNERFSAFATGSAAMMSPWITDIMPLDDPQQSLVTDSYATTAPVTEEGVDQVTPIGGYSMGISKYAAESDLATDFLLWFTTPQTAYRFIENGGLPARYSLINDANLCAKYRYYSTLQEVVDTAFCAFRPQIPESFEIMDTVGEYIAKYLDDSMGLEEAMSAADDAVAEILIKGGYQVSK